MNLFFRIPGLVDVKIGRGGADSDSQPPPVVAAANAAAATALLQRVASAFTGHGNQGHGNNDPLPKGIVNIIEALREQAGRDRLDLEKVPFSKPEDEVLLIEAEKGQGNKKCVHYSKYVNKQGLTEGPILISELARRILKEQCPPFFRGYHVYTTVEGHAIDDACFRTLVKRAGGKVIVVPEGNEDIYITYAADEQRYRLTVSQNPEDVRVSGAAAASTLWGRTDIPIPPGVVDLTEQLWRELDSAALRKQICLGRERDLELIMACLATKNAPPNVLVYGAAGIGKTILPVELARRILIDDVPSAIRGFHVFKISTDFMDLDSLKKFAEAMQGKVIFIFDECHVLFEKKGGFFDFFLGKSLSDEMKCFMGENQPAPLILLTDRAPYSLFESKDAHALNRRLFMHQLREVPFQTAVTLIKGKNVDITFSQKCRRPITFAPGCIELATKLAMASITEETLPGKVYRILEPAITMWSAGHDDGTALEIGKDALYHYLRVKSKWTSEQLDKAVLDIDAMLMVHTIPADEPLMRYSRNLTLDAKQGKFEPLWGEDRNALIEQIILLLHAKEGRNVALTGPAGSGKSRIAEELARQIASGAFPQLEDVQVLRMDIERLSDRGMFSEFIKSAEMYGDKFILIVDEAHRLATSFKQGSASAIDNLKEAWGRGKIPTVLLTTEREYALFSQDNAFQRRFSHLHLHPFTLRQTIQFLKERPPQILAEKQIEATSAALESIVYLSKIYFPQESQPSAAIKALAHVCSATDFANQKRVDENFVIGVFAYLHSESNEVVREKLIEERAADHPLTQISSQSSLIRQYCDDLTREALVGHLPYFSSVPSREQALHSLIALLGTSQCNNAILHGSAGTGKTALVKELAQRIAADDPQLPNHLRGKPIFSLKQAQISSFKEPQNLAAFIDELNKYGGQFLLFVDEVHLLLPYLEVLKPYLSDGRLSLIGATTEPVQRGFDDALSARFDIINIPQLQRSEALQLLKDSRRWLQNSLQKSLKVAEVRIGDKALEDALDQAESAEWPRSAIKRVESAVVSREMRDRTGRVALDRIERSPTAAPALAPGRFSSSWGILSGLKRMVSWVAYPFIQAAGYFFRSCIIRPLLPRDNFY